MEEERFHVVGTTGIGMKVLRGIIVGVDSMATGLGFGEGPEQSNPPPKSSTYNKFFEVCYKISCVMAGLLIPGEAWLTDARNEWRYSVNFANVTMTVQQIALYVVSILKRNHPDIAGQVRFIIAGFEKKVANLFEVDISGSVAKDLVVVGSSVDTVREFIEDREYRPDMDHLIAAEIVREAICKAGLKDPCTGGDSIKVYHITADGTKLLSDDTYASLKLKFYPNDEPDEELMVLEQGEGLHPIVDEDMPEVMEEF
ncbi:hypothetical protein MKW94_002112 [Papaver nudicaule]|uniref:Uncharacterized protein n=1 Tax=Papaver nudicaule TaxID=74823 RepID=A0AA41VAD9_PAPNU|nr:hypothetical protein [Papaver nudicaule]